MNSFRLRVLKFPLTENPPAPLLLAGGSISIGRRDDNGWVLPDASSSVSRKHATVEERNGVWRLIDESANGTLHNGQIVGRGNAKPLTAGDMIKIGDYEIVVEPTSDGGGGGRPGFAPGPAMQPLADPYGIGDLGNAGFGAQQLPNQGPSPFDPPPPERLAEAPRGVDLFGDFGADQVAPGIGVRGGSDASPVASFGGLDAPADSGHGPSPFGPASAPGGSPFGPASGPGSPFGNPPGADTPFGGRAPARDDDWGAAPDPVPSAGPMVNDPFSNPGGGSVFGDQFGSADAIRNPLAGPNSPRGNAAPSRGDSFNPSGAPSVFGAENNPFGAADPVGYGREQAPAALGFEAVAIPEIGGPGHGAPALPSDWNAAPPSGPAAPPADLDPIEQALAGLQTPGRPAGQAAAPVAQPTPQRASAPAPDLNRLPPDSDFFALPPSQPVPMEDAFAHPAAPLPAATSPQKGIPVGTPSGPAATPAAAFQQPAAMPAAMFQQPAPTPSFQQPAAPPSFQQPQSAPPAAFQQPAAAAAVPRPGPAGAAQPRPSPAPPRPATGGGADALRGFMEGAGLQQIPPDLDPAQAMRTLGASTRAIVSTLARLLEARRLLKGEFRITQTVVGARENNPLKFSVDESELMLVLLGAVRPGFQRGEAAVWDAGRDLEAHQLAMLSAFRAVLDAVFARLAPEAVSSSGEEAGFFGRLLPQARDAALWERYTKVYGDLRQDIGNTLAGRLGQIFAEAYEAENGRRGGSR